MKISKFFTILLHPVFMPTIVIFVILNEVEFFNILFSSHKKSLYSIVIIFTLVLPLIISIFFLKLKRIKSLEMETIEERNSPLFYTIIVMILGFSFFKTIAYLSPYLCSVYFSSIIILILAFLITKKWKISLHMLGIGGATGSFFALNIVFGSLYYWVIAFFFLSGMLAFSRLDLQAHNRLQVYSGFFLGCFIQSILILYFSSSISTISIFLSNIAFLL